ncbi:MAG: NAD(P)-binding domain-containing protein [Caldilineaceae bacterium]|nr:NAD(P)-binding domain-containing protein [Caldilineaceae bacterium]
MEDATTAFSHCKAPVAGQLIGILSLRAFFESLPSEMFDACRIDGTSDGQIYCHVTLPLARSMLGVVAVLNIPGTWNNLIWPTLTLSERRIWPLTPGLYSYMEQYHASYGRVMAGLLLGSVPLVILLVFTSRLFVEGLTSGAIKTLTVRISAEKLAERIRPINTFRYDVIVVGGGGWGLAVLKVLADMVLRVLGIERKEICHNLRHYMKRMVMHSRLSYMVLDPDDAILAQKGETHHPLIEELIQSYSDFALTVSDPEDRTVRLGAKRVVLATGSFDNPILAVMPGELDAAVHHYFHEWVNIRGKKILFIGGGFSSADGIIALCQRNSILWVVRKSNNEVDQMLTD